LGALFALIVSLGASIQTTRAAELIMVERDGCPWCDAFDREVAPIFTRTPEGRRAPLRRIDLYKPAPADLAFLQIERLTPLFILVDEGREIGRIRGYPGPEGFWTQLSMLMDRLPQNATALEQASLTTPLRADY
jgi:thioredoxin-related protein